MPTDPTSSTDNAESSSDSDNNAATLDTSTVESLTTIFGDMDITSLEEDMQKIEDREDNRRSQEPLL